MNPFGKTKRIRINGEEAVRTDIDVPLVGDHMIDLYFVRDGYLYTLNFAVQSGDKWKEYSPVFNEMTESFEFLE